MEDGISKHKKVLSWADFPPDFPPFFLDPTGCTLSIREVGADTYALLSDVPNVDNSGFVVGEKGVLVVDSHISVPMARQIQARIREVTDKPLLYLVNTNYHADHTFGNCAFPAQTLLVQHRETADRVVFVDEEREFILPCIGGKREIWEGVTLRLPDVVFDDRLTLDLGGGVVVDLHWFGPANTPGDTIVSVPHAKTAWTGNMTGGGGFSIALESDAPTFLQTLARFVGALDVETLVPAHSPISGPEVLWRDLRYYAQVTAAVKGAIGAGCTLQETVARTPLKPGFASFSSEQPSQQEEARHRYNVHRTYLSLTGQR